MTVAERRLSALLGDGYFPTQLPPPFTSTSFGHAAKKISSAFGAAKSVSSECEVFSVARGGSRRRTIKIPNPISQLLLCRSLSSNWAPLSLFLRGSRLALSRPRFVMKAGERPVRIPSLSELESERVARSGGYRYALVSDITQFFPSLYTHALSWALHTKAVAKAAARTRTRAGFGDDLDLHARNCQSRQTVGVPIGPDSSHLLAEVVGVAIDKMLKDVLGRWPAGYRYVDDFVLFFSTGAEADSALNDLNRVLEHFELRPNEHKTRIVPVERLEVDSWVHSLRRFEFSHTKARQASELHHFFHLAFAEAAAHSSESVMKFALRRVAVEVIRTEHWHIFESYLLRVALSYPDTLQLVSQFFSTYRGLGYPINKHALSRMLHSVLAEHAIYARHSETAWALWVAIQNAVKVKASLIKPLTRSHSSVCALLVLDLQSRGLVSGKLSVSDWSALCSAADLYTSNWMLAYQAERDNLFPGLPSYVAADPDFGQLITRGVTFYDPTRSQRALFSVHEDDDLGLTQNDILRLERNPNPFVEFLDVDEEYIDREI